MVDDDTKMLPIVDDHRCGLKIDGCSKEMMVGIAYCQSRHPTTMQQQQQQKQEEEMEEMRLHVLSQSILAPNEYEMNI
jgi:septin family protein